MATRCLLLVLLLASSAFAQPTISLPEKIDGRPGKFIRVQAVTNGKIVKWYSTDPTLDIFPSELLKDTLTAVVTAERNCEIFAYTALGDVPSDVAVCKIVVGTAPPKPPDPPLPPDPPDPPKPPIPDIPNAYGLGKLAYSAAPADATIAKHLAGIYRREGLKLYGGGALADIVFILKTIDVAFDAKQCRDVATCEKWNEWKVKINAASKAEQVRRGGFTRENWFQSLSEIASGLEAVK